MKNLIIILLAFSIFLSTLGCSKRANNANNTTSAVESIPKASSASEIKSIESSSSNKDTDSTRWEWPTEKWNTSTPEEQDMESGVLLNSDKKINENYPNVYSLLVIRNGYLVYEKYYQGNDNTSSNEVFSVTKSVMSALTGIAIQEKLIESVDQKVAGFFPEYFSQVDDKRKKDITIKNVLTMTGGLETIDSNYNGYFSSGDWLEYAIKKPMSDDPGKKFVYNTGLTHLLSGIVTKSSKMNTFEFAKKNLFNPLGMDVRRWNRDLKGYFGGGTGLYLTPRDMAKFGLLYIKNGMWDEKQILPSEWVKESTRKQLSADTERNYGYLFWSWDTKTKVKDRAYYTYAAMGAGGQYIIVVPDLDIVTVISSNINSSSKDKSDTAALFWDYVLPAVK